VADVSIRAFFERRRIQWRLFSSAEFTAKVNPTEEDLRNFYQANPSRFQAPEEADMEYVLLDLATLQKNITINEADLRAYYAQNAARLGGPQELRASHILINAAKTATAAERQKARAWAEQLLAQVRQTPNKFAELAQKNSQDPGSAVRGGDLGYFTRGAMVKPFEEAVFAMQKGDINGLVESDFGYHIIQLTDIKTPEPARFEELRAQLEADLKTQQAKQQFAEAADIFTNMVYEQPDSLLPVAQKLKLKIQTASRVKPQPTATETGLLANPKLLAAVFSPDAIQKKHNTEAIEITPDQLVAARITTYSAARTLPLAQVHTAVRDMVVAARAADLAKQAGLAKLALWKNQPAQADLPATSVLLARDQASPVPQPILMAALRTDASTLPAIAGVDLGHQGYAIFRINKVEERAAPEAATLKRDREEYGQTWVRAETQAYYEFLKERLKTQIKAPKPQDLPSAVTGLTG
jgi:peptidyl-prolyl cis-trans isomerase D